MMILLFLFMLSAVFPSAQTMIDSTNQVSQKTVLPVAVLALDARGVSLQEAEILTERLRSILVQDGRYQVVERSQMETILQEQGFQQSGCTTNECLIQAGQILGVYQMIGGTVGRIGGSYTIDIRLFDVESTQILKAVTRNFNGPIDGLLNLMGEVGVELADDGSSGASQNEDQLTAQANGQDFELFGVGLDEIEAVIDTTARNIAQFLTPKPKDPDIKLGKQHGKLDAQDYRGGTIWFIPTFVTTGAILYQEKDSKEQDITNALIAGLAAKIVMSLIAGDPRLPENLVEKIGKESVVYQDSYRRSWVKEVKKIRSNRADSGCILGLALGYAAVHNYSDK